MFVCNWQWKNLNMVFFEITRRGRNCVVFVFIVVVSFIALSLPVQLCWLSLLTLTTHKHVVTVTEKQNVLICRFCHLKSLWSVWSLNCSVPLSCFIDKTSDKPKSGTLKSPPKGFDTTIISKTYYNVVRAIHQETLCVSACMCVCVKTAVLILL